MVKVRGDFYALDPNNGEKVSPDVAISRVADISATEGHIVPTGKNDFELKIIFIWNVRCVVLRCI